MKVYLIDGTYELFRSYFALPTRQSPDGREMGAVMGLIASILALLRDHKVTHGGCAFDHVIPSFRNDMFPGYKTGAGVAEELLEQFPLAERAMGVLGLAVWPMVEFEADDALASVIANLKSHEEVEQFIICTPDKDLAQMVDGRRVVCLDRRQNIVLDEDGVLAKFGVPPASIPDYLALVGDSADGIPGIPRWGAKSTATTLGAYGSLENIPADPAQWEPKPRGAATMAKNLFERFDDAKLYRTLATLRTDAPVPDTLEALRWQGVDRPQYEQLCEELDLPSRFLTLPHRWAV